MTAKMIMDLRKEVSGMNITIQHLSIESNKYITQQQDDKEYIKQMTQTLIEMEQKFVKIIDEQNELITLLTQTKNEQNIIIADLQQKKE